MKKLIFILLLAFVAQVATAQVSLLSTFGLTSDTTVNTGVTILTSPRNLGPKQTTVVQVTATKISGTVAGTISLLGSVDGTDFKAILLPQVATALNTYTATDVASQTFDFYVVNNPYLYYRVSWTGAGTMSASFTAKILSR